MFKPQDHYFHAAKKKWYVARSIFKLQEIDQKFGLFTKHTSKILDIGCAPGSWLQYCHDRVTDLHVPHPQIIGFDLKPVRLDLSHITTYAQDVTDSVLLDSTLSSLGIAQFDMILSDLAPNTIWQANIDAMRCIEILERILPVYERYLKPGGTFATKIFMWPGFEEYVSNCKKIRWASKIKVFKPKACREESKETYVVKWR